MKCPVGGKSVSLKKGARSEVRASWTFGSGSRLVKANQPRREILGRPVVTLWCGTPQSRLTRPTLRPINHRGRFPLRSLQRLISTIKPGREWKRSPEEPQIVSWSVKANGAPILDRGGNPQADPSTQQAPQGRFAKTMRRGSAESVLWRYLRPTESSPSH